MVITDPLTLPADVVIMPVARLSAPLRRQVDCADDDFAVTRPQSRTPSKIIDPQAAELLRQFQTPKTIVEAIIGYSRAQQTDPEATLVDAYPLLQHFIQAGLLVAPESEAASRITSSFQAGDRVDDFEVLACIQVLEDSELYQVRHGTQTIAALKILRVHGQHALQYTLAHEAAILRHLDGRVSPALVASQALDGRPYLAMEWCPGVPAIVAAEELRRIGGAEGRERLRDLCLAILDAYAHLHAQHVIHSDVHPNNILVDGDGSVKIIDYGLARLEGATGAIGEPPRGGVGFFFEPEYACAIRDPRQPPRSSMAGEQYGLAALVYLLLTGAHYLDFSLEKHEMFRQIAEEDPLPFARRGVEPWLAVEQVLARALRKAPADRFDSVAEFAHALRTAGEHALPASEAPARSLPRGAPAAATELLDEVLQRVGHDGPLLASGLTLAPTASVNYGAAGIAYALYRIACVRDDAALLSLADIWATRAARDIGQSAGFYNDAIDITPETVGTISIYHTPSGIHAVQALISGAMGDMASQQMAIEGFITASQAPCESLDLTLGRSSTLLGCALLFDALPRNEWLRGSTLPIFGDQVLRAIWDRLDTFAPLQECSEIDYLGIAHGWGGMLYATLRWCQVSGSPLPGGVTPRLQQLAACAEYVGRGARWKWMLHQPAHPGNAMPGWCNGSAGYVPLWTLAHEMLHDPAYLKLAEKAAWNAWEHAGVIGNLCCGLAGQAYAMLNLYRYTGEHDWLRRAHELAGRAAAGARAAETYSANPAMALDLRGDSLYKGAIGVAVLAADLSRPELSCMPFFEREG